MRCGHRATTRLSAGIEGDRAMNVTVKRCFSGAGRLAAIVVIAGFPLGYTGARADTILWAIDANANGTPTAPVIEKWDINEPAGTGTLINSFLAPNPAAQGHQAQGIAVVGSNIFYSVADSGSVFLTNPGGTDLGVAFNTGLRGISTIASDGSFLYLGGIADHNVYKYTFGGTL